MENLCQLHARGGRRSVHAWLKLLLLLLLLLFTCHGPQTAAFHRSQWGLLMMAMNYF